MGKNNEQSVKNDIENKVEPFDFAGCFLKTTSFGKTTYCYFIVFVASIFVVALAFICVYVMIHIYTTTEIPKMTDGHFKLLLLAFFIFATLTFIFLAASIWLVSRHTLNKKDRNRATAVALFDICVCKLEEGKKGESGELIKEFAKMCIKELDEEKRERFD